MTMAIEGLSGLVEIGRGGFGVVYRADQARYDRVVAVKVIRNTGTDPAVAARFERECRALGLLSGHPNIVALHDSGATGDGDLYLVMEHLGGGSLAQRIARHGPVDPSLVARWGVVLAGALDTAHQASVIHRDVKPENVLFSDFDVPKLVDFGIARMRSAYETRTGSVSATLGHAAPELIAGGAVTAATDTYSLASVLHFALRGRAPFDRGSEDSLAPLIARITTEAPPDLRLAGVPDVLAAAIERGLAKDPADRFPSAAAFGEALRSAAAAMGVTTGAVPTTDAGAVVAADPGATTTPTDELPEEHTGTVQVDRRRLVAPSPDAPDEPATPVRPRRGRRWAAVVGVVALLGTGLALALNRSAGSSDDQQVQASTPAAFVDQFETSEGLRIERRYAASPHDGVQAEVTIVNPTDVEVRTVWFEAFPAELAARSDQVTFAREPAGRLDDPVVAHWVVGLAPDAQQRIGWQVARPAQEPVDEAALARVASAQRAMVDELAEVLEPIRAAAADRAPDLAGDPTEPAADVAGGAVVGADPGVPTTDGPRGAPGGAPRGAAPGGVPAGGGAPAPNHPPTIAVRDQHSDELQAVMLTIDVYDPDGDPLQVTIAGLPAGLSANGARISGSIAHDAANATSDRRASIGSESRTVTVSVDDGRGGVATRSFTWTVRDTHRTMPNYIDQFGCAGCGGLPDVAAVSTPRFDCAHQPGGTGDRIFRQGVAPGSVISWGQPITYWYGKDDPACASVGKGW